MKAKKLNQVSRIRGSGESRVIVLDHTEAQYAARLVRVETGGVDRQTGAPLKTYFEVTAKVPRQPEVTRTFTHERNARIAYLMAQHGETDFSTPLGEIGPRVWAEPKNLTALAALPCQAPPVSPAWTRMPTGDSEADLTAEALPAPTTRPDRPGLFREVPVEELDNPSRTPQGAQRQEPP